MRAICSRTNPEDRQRSMAMRGRTSVCERVRRRVTQALQEHPRRPSRSLVGADCSLSRTAFSPSCLSSARDSAGGGLRPLPHLAKTNETVYAPSARRRRRAPASLRQRGGGCRRPVDRRSVFNIGEGAPEPIWRSPATSASAVFVTSAVADVAGWQRVPANFVKRLEHTRRG
jgi:hypothetical protein